MNRFGMASAFGVLALMADTGANVGGAAGSVTETNAPATPAAGVKKSHKISGYASVEEIKASTQPKGYKRYEVKGPDGVIHFVAGRDSNAAVGFAAQKTGWSVDNLDSSGLGAGRKPTKEKVLTALDNMSDADRAEILRKYGIAPAASAAAETKPAAETKSAATTPAKTGGKK